MVGCIINWFTLDKKKEIIMNSLDTFITKHDSLKIDLMNYFLETDQSLYTMKSIENNFTLSTYMLRETIEALNIDINNLFKFDWLLIKKGIIYQKYRVSRYHLYKLSQFYFNLSPLKILLEKRSLSGSLPTYTSIQAEYGWSTSYFFTQKNILDNIIMDQNPFEFIQAGYAIYNYFDEKPSFSGRIKSISHAIIDFLLDTYLINDMNLQQKELLIDFYVSEMINNGRYCLTNVSEPVIYTLQKLPDSIALQVSGDPTIFLSKLLEVLDLFDFLQESNLYWFSPEIEDKILKAQQKITPLLSRYFKTLSFSKISLLGHQISKYSQRFSMKTQWFFRPEGVVNLKYFQDIYPSIFTLLPEIIKILNDQQTIIFDSRQNLFEFNLIGIMFNDIAAINLDKIEISVNFTATQMTNNMIITMLKSHINHASVYFTQNQTNADIYLSDTIDEKSRGEQVIWKKPPTLSDWRALGELIVKIKKNEKKKI